MFKSALDTRCDTTVVRTHDGISFTATAVSDSRTIDEMLSQGTQVVAIEEIQFLDDAVVGLCQRLADRGVEVIVPVWTRIPGLPFGFMPQLMALADNVMKLHAICKVCGGEASRTQRLVDGRPAKWDEPTILIGADETYEARCRHCHQVREAPDVRRQRRANGERRVCASRTSDTEARDAQAIEDPSQLTMFQGAG